MYGLNQEDITAYNQLILHMKPHGYYPVLFKTKIWAHKTRKKILYVDDFGVKYFSKDDANHLLNPLKSTMQFQRIMRGAITSN